VLPVCRVFGLLRAIPLRFLLKPDPEVEETCQNAHLLFDRDWSAMIFVEDPIDVQNWHLHDLSRDDFGDSNVTLILNGAGCCASSAKPATQ
jgi:hypothetical protein